MKFGGIRNVYFVAHEVKAGKRGDKKGAGKTSSDKWGSPGEVTALEMWPCRSHSGSVLPVAGSERRGRAERCHQIGAERGDTRRQIGAERKEYYKGCRAR